MQWDVSIVIAVMYLIQHVAMENKASYCADLIK